MFWAENYNKAVRMYNEYKGSKDKSKLEDAINRFEQTVKIDPSEGQTYSILSTSYYELGDNEKALASAKKANRNYARRFSTKHDSRTDSFIYRG